MPAPKPGPDQPAPAGRAGEAGASPEAPAASDAGRELTPRALLFGCGIGAVLAAGNVYTGLKASLIDGGSITAALLGFTFFATFKRLARRPYLALENNITQTTAASAAIMGFVVGVYGPVPALKMMGASYPSWALAAWGIALGCLGILLAASLRRKLILAENLPFPTGSATAELIETIYTAREKALHRARLLLGVALAAMLFTWFRDARPRLIPQIALFGTTLFGASTAAFSLGLSSSPLMAATGMMVGPRVATSMLASGLVTWAGLAPWLVRRGIVPTASFTSCVSWLVWPALGLLVAGSFLPLVLDWRSVMRSLRDLPAVLRRRGAAADGPGADGAAAGRAAAVAPIVLVCLAVMLWVGWSALNLHPLVTVITLVLAVVLAGVSARAAGETDLAPIGPMGTLTQLFFAGYGPLVSLFAGAISAGKSSQTAQTLWALKAGQRLGASARAQIAAQILGAVLGGLVVVPVYLVIVKSYGVGTEAMPAPAALSWRATAEAVRGGLGAMPQHGPLAGGVGLALGVLLAALARTRAARFVPSPAAMGVAILTPASLSIAAFGGAMAVVVARRLRPQISDASVTSVAAGGIAGESVMGVVIAVLMALGFF
jgi:putative OPT family oligopeptide transporter